MTPHPLTDERLTELDILVEWHTANPGIVGIGLSQQLVQGLRELIEEVRRLRGAR